MSIDVPPTETMVPASPAMSRMQRWRQAMVRRLDWQAGPQFAIALLAAGLSAAAIGINSPAVKSLERQMQQQFWQLRGTIMPPPEVVIVGIDANTLTQISSWPLDRSVYAQAIERLLDAGAKGVALDILLDVPRGAGKLSDQVEDCDGTNLGPGDRQLRQALQKYGSRVTLATSFEAIPGDTFARSRLVLPYCGFLAATNKLGGIDFLTEGDETNPVYYQLGHTALKQLQQSDVAQLQVEDYGITTFAQSALQSAQMSYPPIQGEDIYFYGERNTFTRVSLADVLEPANWRSQFESGEFFRDKLVLIGVTEDTQRDITNTPVGRMSGVELHANAIATLLQGRALRPVLANTWLTASLVFMVVLTAAGLQARAKQPVSRVLWLLGLSITWGAVGYLLMVQASLLLPTMLPMGAIATTGLAYLGLGVARDQRNRRQLESTLKDRARDPVVRDIINQQTDENLRQSLLEGRQQELLGAHIGGGRYQIIQIHAAGGFGETYIAEDLHRPDHPKCVVKKLSPSSSNPKHLKLARRLFQREAETLEKLGQQHDQIPQLLAYFEDNSDFYLVQEFVAGYPLTHEMPLGHQLPETQVVAVLREILQVLKFVHDQQVIHRDLKPSNLIRRERDNRLVLIDFGAVKAVQSIGEDDLVSDLTIGIGTQGYMAPEQQAGHPQFSSDIYAVGMIGVQMLTGIAPSQLSRASETGEIDWCAKTHASVGLVDVIQKMIAYHYKQRYQNIADVLQDLKRLSLHTTLPSMLNELLQDAMPADEEMQATQPWPTQFERDDLPPTEPPPTT